MIQKWLWKIWPLSLLADVLAERDELRERVRQFAALKIDDLSEDERGNLVTTLSADILPLISGALVKQFKDSGGQNFVEWRLYEQRSSEWFALTMQRVSGDTPAMIIERHKRAMECAIELLQSDARWQDATDRGFAIGMMKLAMASSPWRTFGAQAVQPRTEPISPKPEPPEMVHRKEGELP